MRRLDVNKLLETSDQLVVIGIEIKYRAWSGVQVELMMIETELQMPNPRMRPDLGGSIQMPITLHTTHGDFNNQVADFR